MISELAKGREMTLGSRFSREARAGVLGKERERDEPAQTHTVQKRRGV